MAIPILFALSLVNIELKNANATRTNLNMQLITSITTPTLSGALSKSEIPAPVKKAKTIDNESPRNRLSQIFLRLMGWLNKSSINSVLLYK